MELCNSVWTVEQEILLTPQNQGFYVQIQSY